MISTIIIDDEKNCIKALQNDLEMFCPTVNVIDCCQSAKEGILSIKRNNPQLVFLDVEMPWMNGFEMLEVLNKEINFRTVFTTAYDQFALKAFKVSAVDYLLKPVDSTDLVAAIEKVTKAIPTKGDTSNISNLINNASLSAEFQKIAVPNKNGYSFIQASKIIYCKATGAYTELILDDHKKILLTKSLGETESMLSSEQFERIHHSVLVNVMHISQFVRTNGFFVIMDNGDELNVSKSKKEQLYKRLGIR